MHSNTQKTTKSLNAPLTATGTLGTKLYLQNKCVSKKGKLCDKWLVKLS